MPDEPIKPVNGNAGQTYEQVAAASESQIRNLVGIPISLREYEESKIASVEQELAQLRDEVFRLLASRSLEWEKTFGANRDLREQELAAIRSVQDRIEVTLRREISQAADLRTQELRAVADQIDTVRKQVDDRDIANKEAVTKAEVAATTAIAAAANTTATAVTKAETAATNAIVQAAEATKSAIDGVKEGFEQKIITLRDSFSVYASQHKEVHDAEHVAGNKFEQQSQEWARALTEFQRSSERAGENFVKRDVLDDMRRGLEQTIAQRYESLGASSERAEKATNDRIAALEARSQAGGGRDSANTQYLGYLIVGATIAAGILGHFIR